MQGITTENRHRELQPHPNWFVQKDFLNGLLYYNYSSSSSIYRIMIDSPFLNNKRKIHISTKTIAQYQALKTQLLGSGISKDCFELSPIEKKISLRSHNRKTLIHFWKRLEI